MSLSTKNEAVRPANRLKGSSNLTELTILVSIEGISVSLMIAALKWVEVEHWEEHIEKAQHFRSTITTVNSAIKILIIQSTNTSEKVQDRL
jgi:hypothetical protein